MQSVINTATATTVSRISHTHACKRTRMHCIKSVCLATQAHTHKHTKSYTHVQMLALLRHTLTIAVLMPPIQHRVQK